MITPSLATRHYLISLLGRQEHSNATRPQNLPVSGSERSFRRWAKSSEAVIANKCFLSICLRALPGRKERNNTTRPHDLPVSGSERSFRRWAKSSEAVIVNKCFLPICLRALPAILVDLSSALE